MKKLTIKKLNALKDETILVLKNDDIVQGFYIKNHDNILNLYNYKDSHKVSESNEIFDLFRLNDLFNCDKKTAYNSHDGLIFDVVAFEDLNVYIENYILKSILNNNNINAFAKTVKIQKLINQYIKIEELKELLE